MSRIFITTGSAALAAACLSLYLVHGQGRPTSDSGPAKRREEEEQEDVEAPYSPDAFPGARNVETSYGVIKVFEWGPEDGEKVLLVHGMATPCIAMGDMAWELARGGCRVMLFDLFGRGYSGGPPDLPFDERLYTTQILLVLASSPLPWTGAAALHLIGYSLGGALVAAFAAHHHPMLRSLTLVCPAGLPRRPHPDWEHKLLRLLLPFRTPLPECLLSGIVRRRITPALRGREERADDPDDPQWDLVPCSADSAWPRTSDVVRWQIQANDAYLHAYMSTYRYAPMYAQHARSWKRLGEAMARNRDRGQGLRRACIVLGDADALLPMDEAVEDARDVLGDEGVDIHVLKGSHSIAMLKGREVACAAIKSWQERDKL